MLGNSVRKLKQPVPIGVLLSTQMALEQQVHQDTDYEHETQEQKSWAAFCSCFRFAASIYLYRALSGLSVDHPLVQQCVTSAMEIVAGDALSAGLYHCILFPLLIVGSHCLQDEQKVEVRNSLSRTAIYLSFGSLRGQDEFLEKLWAKVEKTPSVLELNWWDYFDEIASITVLF